MIRAIIFDLDGTLCNTIDDIRDGVNAVLTRLGYKERSREDIHKFINHGARNLIKRSLPRDVQNIDFIVESALSDYNNEYKNFVYSLKPNAQTFSIMDIISPIVNIVKAVCVVFAVFLGKRPEALRARITRASESL